MYIYMYVSLSDRENISSQLFRYLSLSPSADKYVNRAGVSLVREGHRVQAWVLKRSLC